MVRNMLPGKATPFDSYKQHTKLAFMLKIHVHTKLHKAIIEWWLYHFVWSRPFPTKVEFSKQGKLLLWFLNHLPKVSLPFDWSDHAINSLFHSYFVYQHQVEWPKCTLRLMMNQNSYNYTWEAVLKWSQIPEIIIQNLQRHQLLTVFNTAFHFILSL